jgi:DtxR family Mn-dependent transcriptional regulator
MGAPGPSAPLLECLDAVHRLERDDPPASVARIAARLGLDPAVTSERLRALEAQGLVRTAGAGRIGLTEAAKPIALRLLRSHRLLECFLADQLKLPWARVHEEACRLAPVLAEDVADALATLLGNPPRCPHGNPIPAADGAIVAERGVPLHRLRPGQRGTILRIEREEPELLRYLATLGLLPHTELEVEEVAPLGGPVLVRVGSARYALGRDVAAHVLVREV